MVSGRNKLVFEDGEQGEKAEGKEQGHPGSKEDVSSVRATAIDVPIEVKIGGNEE